ncbi:hypothetical protein ACWGTI_30215 [Mesorhizobium sp. ArgA1]
MATSAEHSSLLRTDGFDLIADPPPEVRKLRRYPLEFNRYIENNADLIPNYAERHRYGEVVSTAFVESTVNQVIALPAVTLIMPRPPGPE